MAQDAWFTCYQSRHLQHMEWIFLCHMPVKWSVKLKYFQAILSEDWTKLILFSNLKKLQKHAILYHVLN